MQVQMVTTISEKQGVSSIFIVDQTLKTLIFMATIL